MSDPEKPRTLSESSDEPEDQQEGGSDQGSLTEVTDRSDTDSDSSSSDSSSDEDAVPEYEPGTLCGACGKIAAVRVCKDSEDDATTTAFEIRLIVY